MNVLDLFSGIGGFSLGLHRAGMKTVAFCEIESFPQAVLRKNFPGVPIYDDVRTLTAERLRADGINTIDVICGGFPCQPFSVAGKQRGTDDHRHLWPQMFRLIQGIRPTWVIGENVAGFVSMALCEVSSDLEGAGYEVQPFIIPACAVNAPHRRDRVWIVAHANSDQQPGMPNNEQREISGPVVSDANGRESREQTERKRREDFGGRSKKTDVRNTNSARRKEQHSSSVATQPGQHTRELVATGPNWSTESPFCGVAHGIPGRVDRLKGLGNAVVPQIPEIIGRAIMAIDGSR